jgi:hypothetical protein
MSFEICWGAVGIGTTVAVLVAFGFLGSIAVFVLIIISFFLGAISLDFFTCVLDTHHEAA